MMNNFTTSEAQEVSEIWKIPQKLITATINTSVLKQLPYQKVLLDMVTFLNLEKVTICW